MRVAAPAHTAAPVTPTDLHSQLEDLLSTVWHAEANWRFDDRLDLAQTIGATARRLTA
jgi:hypothetical protein